MRATSAWLAPVIMFLMKSQVTGGVDDRVMPLLSVELLRGAGDGDSALTLLFLPVHVKSESERSLPKPLGLGLQLLQLAFREPPQLKDESARGCAFPAVDVSANHDGQMLLLGISRHCCWRLE